MFRDYVVALKTGEGVLGNKSYGSTKDTPWITLVGRFGESSKWELKDTATTLSKADAMKNGCGEDAIRKRRGFTAAGWNAFAIRTHDVGELIGIEIDKPGDDGWMLEKVVVISKEALSVSSEEVAPGRKKWTFSVDRWFDSDQFDRTTKLFVLPDEPIEDPTRTNGAQEAGASRASRHKGDIKYIVMRYDNSEGAETVKMNFDYSYQITKGVSIGLANTRSRDVTHTGSVQFSQESTTKAEASAGTSVASVSVSTELKLSAQQTYSYENSITNAVKRDLGTTVTTVETQTQSTPVAIKPGEALTLIVEVKQNGRALEYGTDGYVTPVTHYDGTVDMTLQFFNRLLTAEEVNKEVEDLTRLIAG